MTSQTGNGVTRRFDNHGFLLVFNTCFKSTVYRSLFIGAVQYSVYQHRLPENGVVRSILLRKHLTSEFLHRLILHLFSSRY
jgi:hypothetical protein